MLLRARLVVLGLSLAAAGPAFAQEQTLDPATVTHPETQTTSIAKEPASPDPSFVKTLGGDFRRLFSTGNVRTAGLFGSAALAAVHWDSPATHEVQELPSRLFTTGNIAGALWTQLGAGLGTMVVGKATKQPQIAALGSELLRAQIVSQVLVQGMKMATERTRPDASNHFSFPSGHTASAFATATVLERRFGWKIGVPAYALSGYVAAARMATNKHYLSDVIVGAAVGVVVGQTIAIGSGHTRFDLGVAPVAGGAALTFTKRN